MIEKLESNMFWVIVTDLSNQRLSTGLNRIWDTDQNWKGTAKGFIHEHWGPGGRDRVEMIQCGNSRWIEMWLLETRLWHPDLPFIIFMTLGNSSHLVLVSSTGNWRYLTQTIVKTKQLMDYTFNTVLTEKIIHKHGGGSQSVGWYPMITPPGLHPYVAVFPYIASEKKRTIKCEIWRLE